MIVMRSETDGAIEVVIVCVLLCLMMPLYAAQAIELCGENDYISVNGGEYYIWNNHDESTAGAQCIDANYDGSFTVTRNDYGAGGGSYPINFRGCHWEWCTPDSNMPARINYIRSAPLHWSISGTSAGGTWNASFEGWVKKTATPGWPDAVEIMIWTNYNGGALPAGSVIATVNIDGATWQLWKAQFERWVYIAYKRVGTSDSLDIDVKHFIDDLVSRGICQSSWYLAAMECGFELYYDDGIGLTSNSFSAMVNANKPPAVSITSPAKGAKFAQGDNIIIEADASDSDGNVAKVKFYQGSTKLGEDTTAPYSCTWNDALPGYHTLTARAIDSEGAETTSSAVAIEVTGGSGTILREWWTGIPGTAVSDLTSSVNYPDYPSGRELITSLEGPTDWANDYGTRIRGYLHPAADGNYTFWIESDANSELRLSTDDSPANASLVARAPEQWESSPILLAKGERYYIEVLHKAGDGSDNVAVAWEGPGLSQQVIVGRYLSPCCLDFRDFARFTAKWRLTGCNASNSWCDGADFYRDGVVMLDDLKAFVDSWLAGIE